MYNYHLQCGHYCRELLKDISHNVAQRGWIAIDSIIPTRVCVECP